MGATTTEGTGLGSVTSVKPPIYNGVVKASNIIVDALKDYRIDLEASGNITADGDLTTHGDLTADGNVSANGYIRGKAEGQFLNNCFYKSTGIVTCNTDSDTTVLSVTYTPASRSSILYIEFHTTYAVNGGGADDFRSAINVGSTELTWRDQTWINGAGGGTRSGTIFPIAGIYTNSSLANKTVTITVRQNGSNDTLTIDKGSCLMRISEFAHES